MSQEAYTFKKTEWASRRNVSSLLHKETTMTYIYVSRPRRISQSYIKTDNKNCQLLYIIFLFDDWISNQYFLYQEHLIDTDDKEMLRIIPFHIS
jgi:hypothetical protein